MSALLSISTFKIPTERGARVQALNNQQADAILDVVEQCWVVTSLNEQKEAGRNRVGSWETAGSKRRAEQVEKDYREAVTFLVDLYLLAFSLKVEDAILEGVLAKNLPPHVVIPLEPTTEQVESD